MTLIGNKVWQWREAKIGTSARVYHFTGTFNSTLLRIVKWVLQRKAPQSARDNGSYYYINIILVLVTLGLRLPHNVDIRPHMRHSYGGGCKLVLRQGDSISPKNGVSSTFPCPYVLPVIEIVAFRCCRLEIQAQAMEKDLLWKKKIGMSAKKYFPWTKWAIKTPKFFVYFFCQTSLKKGTLKSLTGHPERVGPLRFFSKQQHTKVATIKDFRPTTLNFIILPAIIPTQSKPVLYKVLSKEED
ncbi:hypothetical protein GQR58_021732 [Nymphon striatum]|nr:hypothetical protein GQR58_021732 [Nymphon striatum]